MAHVNLTAEQAWTTGRADLDRIDATTEDDIRRHLAEDGFDPDDPLRGLEPVIDSTQLRQRLALSRAEFARRLNVPEEIVRSWESDPMVADPAARALLRLVAADPDRAFAALAS